MVGCPGYPKHHTVEPIVILERSELDQAHTISIEPHNVVETVRRTSDSQCRRWIHHHRRCDTPPFHGWQPKLYADLATVIPGTRRTARTLRHDSVHLEPRTA